MDALSGQWSEQLLIRGQRVQELSMNSDHFGLEQPDQR